jgi:acetyl esterase/lipase
MNVEDWEPPGIVRDQQGVGHVSNATFAAVHGFRPLMLDLHLPVGRGPYPVVVYVHGGAWFSGSRLGLPPTVDRSDFHARTLGRGFAIAEVDYRLSAEAAYPAPLDDVLEALQWLSFWSPKLGLDPARLALLGESAGAHLALMAALTEPTLVEAVIDWYGPTDLVRAIETSPVELSEDPAVQLLGGVGPDLLERAAVASPLRHLHADCPPVICIHGTVDRDVPYSESVNLTAALTRLGVRNELLPVEGADHVFVGCSDIGSLIDAGLDFLARTV